MKSISGRPSVSLVAQAVSHTVLAPSNWSSAGEGPYSVSVLGDLHLEPAQMHLFHEARQQLVQAMSGDSDGVVRQGARVVQLGDLGGYKHRPGSRDCFAVASEYLSTFGVPVALITGNHDLEGDEFECDRENLTAWQEAFQQNHYWALPLGPVLAVGLSTVRFRSNAHSVHEVYIDDDQMAWFGSVLEQNTQRPIIIFTHAPPMGSGLKVVQNVHVKNRCAWLNHSDRPQRFMQLVERHPNIKVWFSGHFHLSQNYADSISVVGSCAFVQTGVIGECNRDGNRQSRLLRFDDDGYQLYTVDHGDAGRLRLDLQHSWNSQDAPSPILPGHDLIADPNAGWLCSQLECSLDGSNGSGGSNAVKWLAAGPNCLLAVQDDLLVEYDMQMRAPLGLVAFLEGRQASLVTQGGGPPQAEDGSDAVAVVLTDPATGATTRLERNAQGSFYRVFQPNKWRLKKEAEAEAAKQAAAETAAAAAVLVGGSRQ